MRLWCVLLLVGHAESTRGYVCFVCVAHVHFVVVVALGTAQALACSWAAVKLSGFVVCAIATGGHCAKPP